MYYMHPKDHFLMLESITEKHTHIYIYIYTEFGYKLIYSQFTTTHYVTINKIIHVYFSHMTYLISHVTSLNNTCG
jgi:hypothetical protein